MKKNTLSKAILAITVLALVSAIPYASAFAWGWSGGAGRDHRGHNREVVVYRGSQYHYREGRFYRPSLFGYVVIRPPVGIIVAALPIGHTTIFMRGTRYYYYDNIYYEDCPSGYVVVPAPVTTTSVAALPAAQGAVPSNTIIINVPNRNGSYTPVTLIKVDNGYIGPQGEFYPNSPTIEQLKALYGK